jgi:hypothetical protein
MESEENDQKKIKNYKGLHLSSDINRSVIKSKVNGTETPCGSPNPARRQKEQIR